MNSSKRKTLVICTIAVSLLSFIFLNTGDTLPVQEELSITSQIVEEVDTNDQERNQSMQEITLIKALGIKLVDVLILND